MAIALSATGRVEGTGRFQRQRVLGASPEGPQLTSDPGALDL